ncbi:MAG: response regulator transcription factor [Kordiimonadaceae bacterium]|nr:response regulator transcription factor [Kordiimonadaceae bacterium]
MSTTVLIADDHALFRQGFVSILSKFEVIDRIIEAADGKQALDKVLSEPVDIAILDIRLPHLTGIDVAREIRRRDLPMRLILMTGEMAEETAATAVAELNVDAFLFKTAHSHQFEQAVRNVLDGGSFFTPDLPTSAVPRTDPKDGLSKREKQVVRLIAEGHTSETASQILGISYHTLRKHRENIRRKLGLNTVAELSLYAVRNELL